MLNVLVLGLSALILSVPAALFPFLQILISDSVSSVTLLQASDVMFTDGFAPAGLVILLTSLIFPLIYLILMTYIAFACVYKKRLPFLWSAVRVVDVFQYFQMTDVFIVGILVSIVKLVDMADVKFGAGFYCLVVMSFMIIAAGVYYDKRLFWCRREHD